MDEKIEQKVIIENNFGNFKKAVSDALDEGWRIVPEGTVIALSMAEVNGKSVTESRYFVVFEK